jgi:SAM-dependent methyltransferase
MQLGDYTSGEYLKRNPDWHVGESAWKSALIFDLLNRHNLHPGRVCELGCGAGEVLRQLQLRIGEGCRFDGFDISPVALRIASERANRNLSFELISPNELPTSSHYDVLLMLDLLEHIEDCFGLLRRVAGLAEHKILHIPLDLSVQTILRPNGLIKVRDWYGHLHYLSKETALRMLADVGYEVIESRYTPRAIGLPAVEFTRKLAKLPRRILSALNEDLAARVLGGWSLLVLAR